MFHDKGHTEPSAHFSSNITYLKALILCILAKKMCISVFFNEIVCGTALNLGDDPGVVSLWSGMLKCTHRNVWDFMRLINVKIIWCQIKTKDAHFVAWMWSHMKFYVKNLEYLFLFLRKVVTCFQKIPWREKS